MAYEATFPLLLNIGGEPTYFIALKDNAGLVKKYAMVNVQKYQVVGIGDTVNECEEEYHKLLLKEGIQIETDVEEETEVEVKESVTGVVTKIAQGVVEGNSHYYIMVEGSEDIYDVSVVDFIEIIRYEVGDEITLEYENSEEVKNVTAIK